MITFCSFNNYCTVITIIMNFFKCLVYIDLSIAVHQCFVLRRSRMVGGMALVADWNMALVAHWDKMRV